MERNAAIKKLERLIGKKLMWRINPKAPGREAREAARAALPAAKMERDKLKEQRDARHREILDADLEYQRLRLATKAAQEDVDRLVGAMDWFKITVGENTGWAFLVKAQGDSWEEVIAKLTPKKVAA